MSHRWPCAQPVAYFTEEVNPSLAKSTLNFNGGLGKLVLIPQSSRPQGDKFRIHTDWDNC